MRVFLDSNVFIAAVTDEPELGSTATELLNREHEFQTSLINLMEIRAVLARKKRRDRGRIEQLERQILMHADLIVPDTSDVIAANTIQERTFLHPMDSLVKACADGQEAVLATFDSELADAGAVSPASLLS